MFPYSTIFGQIRKPALFALGCLLFFSGSVLAQQPATIISPDSSQRRMSPLSDTVLKTRVSKVIVLSDTSLDPYPEKEIRFAPSPRKAALYSAVLPGLGQAYNRSYWKIPIIYAGAAAAIYAFNFNNTEYQRFREAYILRRNGDNTTASLAQFYPDINQLSNARDFYRYYRDYSAILGLLLYGMQIADAAVDAHLTTFSVKDDLKLSLQPSMIPLGNVSTTPGVTATFHLLQAKSSHKQVGLPALR